MAAGILLATFSPLTGLWARAYAGAWHDPTGDVLAVLAADALSPGDVLAIGSYWRAAYTVRAWRAGSFRRIVISGGGQPPVAEMMREYLVGHGVPAAAITVETASRSTRENALGLARIAAGHVSAGHVSAGQVEKPGERWVLLTSEYHMFRAVRACRRAGLTVVPRPVPDLLLRRQSWLERPAVLAELVQESAKIAAYWWKGWI